MAILAIKGHATRGREVIELLEMLGGVNEFASDGKAIAMADNSWAYYTISKIGEFICIIGKSDDRPDAVNWKTFTLEEFLEKFPYKVGDKVLVKGYDSPVNILLMTWNGSEIEYRINTEGDWLTADELQPYKEETTMEGKLTSKEEMSLKIDTSQMEKRQIVFSADAPNETELVLGDNFEIKFKDGKTYVVRKKPKYPKTYEECCEILNVECDFLIDIDIDEVFTHLIRLKRCRDAYLKIAGEQMGLGKPWEPDWKNEEQFKYGIYNYEGNIQRIAWWYTNIILAFPSEAICNAFYENFEDLIEECKELL